MGATTFDAGLELLRPRGMMVLYGASSGPVPPLDPQLLNRQGSQFLTRPTLAHYIAARGELGGRYGLEDAGRAHEDLEGRRTTGQAAGYPVALRPRP